MAGGRIGIVPHLKNKGHAWSIGLSLLAAVLYLWFGIAHELLEQQLVANVVLTLVAAMTVVGGLITLIVMAAMTKADFGELIESRTQLITGVLVGVTISTIKLLGLFGLLSIPARAAARTQDPAHPQPSANTTMR